MNGHTVFVCFFIPHYIPYFHLQTVKGDVSLKTIIIKGYTFALKKGAINETRTTH